MLARRYNHVTNHMRPTDASTTVEPNPNHGFIMDAIADTLAAELCDKLRRYHNEWFTATTKAG